MTAPGGDAVVARLFALLEERGVRSYDGRVSQLEHAIQCAQLAARHGAGESLVVAALLHDVGHLLEDDRDGAAALRGVDLHHETVGSVYLRRWFPPAVTTPVALHVRAKRYLVAVDADYAGRLSPGSRQSLAVQGGPLPAPEAAVFASLPFAEAAVQLRRWDDEAKVGGLALPALASFASLVRGALRPSPPGA